MMKVARLALLGVSSFAATFLVFRYALPFFADSPAGLSAGDGLGSRRGLFGEATRTRRCAGARTERIE